MSTKLAESILGFSGRLISWSKSGYRNKYPDNLVIFNANVATINGKIWWGDLDVTLDKDKLKQLAIALNETVYVLYEMDGRFGYENNPQIDRAIYSITPEGIVGGRHLQ
jgi:hypothetical protein